MMLYEHIDIYRRVEENKIIVYRCWRLLPGGRYVVQSADHIRCPVTHEDLIAHRMRFLELFSETAPEERAESYPTIEEAVRAFDAEFEDDVSNSGQ